MYHQCKRKTGGMFRPRSDTPSGGRFTRGLARGTQLQRSPNQSSTRESEETDHGTAVIPVTNCVEDRWRIVTRLSTRQSRWRAVIAARMFPPGVAVWSGEDALDLPRRRAPLLNEKVNRRTPFGSSNIDPSVPVRCLLILNSRSYLSVSCVSVWGDCFRPGLSTSRPRPAVFDGSHEPLSEGTDGAECVIACTSPRETRSISVSRRASIRQFRVRPTHIRSMTTVPCG